jgi:hypothetical protein
MLTAFLCLNVPQILLCGYMVVGTILAHRRRNLSVICNAFDQTDIDMATMQWVFYVSKALDFMDTCT